MKSIIFHSVSVVISLFWIITEHHTYNPISLKGPDFLQFYLILLTGFYTSIFILKFFKESVSKGTVYFAVFIIILGIIKLIKGVTLGKPVGYLLMILIVEIIVMLIIMSIKLNNKIK